MGIFTRRSSAVERAHSDVPSTSFAITNIDPAVFGLSSWDGVAGGARVSRSQAMQCAPVVRCRDIICNSLASLPLDLIGPDKQDTSSPLFTQPERYVGRSVTIARTVEDLLFHGMAVWKVTERGWDRYPTKIKRIDADRVEVDEDKGEVRVDGTRVDDADVIIFTSPNDPLLASGARVIRTALALDAAAATASDGVPPMGILTVDPDTVLDDAGTVEVQDAWRKARRENSTALLQGVKYQAVGWSPEQLQLAQARQHAALEIARLTGIRAEDLGIPVTSRDYANEQDNRKNFIDFTLAGYRAAIEQRLSLGDVTKYGYQARFNFSAFLRSDDATRMGVYKTALEVGALTREEIRELEDRPPLTDARAPETVPAPAMPLTAEVAA